MDRLSTPDPHSEAESCTGPVESVGSVEIAPSNPKLLRLRRSRKREKPREETGSKILQCCMEMRDVPVHDAWAFVRDHQIVANLIPGILERCEYLEGDGGPGSIYLSSYTAEHTKPGDISFVMNRVEVRDDISHLHAVRCVGGKYRQRYKLFLSFLKVLPDDSFGDGSSLVIWRSEYQLQHPDAAIPEDCMAAHKFCIELFRDVHSRSNRVERPIFDRSQAAAVMKPWRLRPTGTVAQLEAGGSAQRRRKSRVVKRLVKNEEPMDGDDDDNISTGRFKGKRRTGVLVAACSEDKEIRIA